MYWKRVQSAQLSAAAYAQMRPVNAELQGSLDAKHAKVGDAVVLKTTEKMAAADGTVLPKGTRLVGHVTQVQAHDKASPDSALAIVFDRAELKGGGSVAIYTEIRSLTPPVLTPALATAGGDDDFGGNAVGGGRTLGGGRMGVGGAGAGGAGNATGRVVPGVGATANDGLRATADAADRTHVAVGAEGGLATHATGVEGVLLTGDASGHTSGSLTARKENVHLDSGTQIVLGVVTAR